MNFEDFILKSRKHHGNKYEYISTENYSAAKVKIVCPNHGEFSQSPFDHAKGVGCAKCFSDSLKTWSPEEDSLLIEKYKTNKAKWCAKKLNKTLHSVRGRATVLGIAKKQRVYNENIPGFLWNNFLGRAKDFRLQIEPFDFDSNYIWELYEKQKGICALSGWSIKFSNKRLENTVSIDRIDSNKGYSKSNIQLTHKLVNRCKLNLPENLFVQLCKSVYQNHQASADSRTLVWEDDLWNDTVMPVAAQYQFEDEYILDAGIVKTINDFA